MTLIERIPSILLLLVTILSYYSIYCLSSEPEPAHKTSFRRQQVKREVKVFDEANIRYETKWFTQLTDHFTWSNQDTWQQRYLVNQDYWCGKNCPILFYCGNEGDIEVFTNNTGFMWENAQNLHAMLVFAEHRFYGKSFPYPVDYRDISPNAVKTLGYLSSEQALADYARLIYQLKNHIYDAKYSPVIAIGGSYGGMLAAWMRMKYPNSVIGALAGSAPILQFPGEYDCGAFYRIVTKDYENYSKFCSQAISKSWSVMRDFTSNDEGLIKLSSMFNTCDRMQSNDVVLLQQALQNIWVNLAMTDYANPASFLSKLPAYPIKHVCSILNSDPINMADDELLKNIAKASQIYTNYTGQLNCLNISNYVYDPMDLLWDFQSCTEMIMPICSDENDMFDPQPFNVSEFVQDCYRRWGTKTQVDKIKTLYGDKNMASVSNIIFSSCSRDPWSAGCPQESLESNKIYAIKIQDACHHEELRFLGPGTTDFVKKARQQELNIISAWVLEHYERIRNLIPSNESLHYISLNKTKQ